MNKEKIPYKLSIVVPCWERPARTRRIINNILAQKCDYHTWEAFVIGDGCPQFQNMIDGGEVDYFQKQASKRGNKFHMFNMDKNYGGCGYHIVNYAVENAFSNYFIFAGNDDILTENHFIHYLSEIEGTDLDLVYYKTFVCPENKIRDPKLVYGSIGHSELIIKTSIVKKTKHMSGYGHDFDFIQQVLKLSTKMKKAESPNQTYVVTHIPTIGSCDNID